SIFARVPSWKAYEESMLTNCQMTGFVGYAVRHNPPPYFTSLSGCTTFDVPYTELQTDLDQDALPAFSFSPPNTVDDMHDAPDSGFGCSSRGSTPRSGCTDGPRRRPAPEADAGPSLDLGPPPGDTPPPGCSCRRRVGP